MQSDVARRLENLTGADSSEATALAEEVKQQVSSGNVEWVASLGAEIVRRIAAEGKEQSTHIFLLNRVQTALAASPGPQSLHALMRVPITPQNEGPARTTAERSLATLVARGQLAEDIAAVVYAGEPGLAASHEFRACLLQELVLAGVPVTEHPVLRSFGETLVAEEHPLAALPLHLLPAERGLRKPQNTSADWTWVLPPASVAAHSDQPSIPVSEAMRRRSADVQPSEITSPEAAESMGAAVRHWCEQSNGKIAAQEFWSPTSVSPDDFAAIVERLPLTAWPEGQTPPQVHPASSDRVLRVLLTAAVLSPAYGSGLMGAYGRLATWRSLSGLTGAPPNTSISDTAVLVEQAHWFLADPSSDWFDLVTRDLALAVLRPGGQEIAVLTATDTD